MSSINEKSSEGPTSGGISTWSMRLIVVLWSCPFNKVFKCTISFLKCYFDSNSMVDLINLKFLPRAYTPNTLLFLPFYSKNEIEKKEQLDARNISHSSRVRKRVTLQRV